MPKGRPATRRTSRAAIRVGGFPTEAAEPADASQVLLRRSSRTWRRRWPSRWLHRRTEKTESRPRTRSRPPPREYWNRETTARLGVRKATRLKLPRAPSDVGLDGARNQGRLAAWFTGRRARHGGDRERLPDE